jgi:hypothetical protein
VEAGGVAEALDTPGMRQQCSPESTDPSEHVTASGEDDPNARALDDVASVPDNDFERAVLNPRRSELEAMHDSTRHPHEDFYADPHSDRDPCSRGGLRREQHDRGVVAGERAGRRSRRDSDDCPPTRCEHEPPRLQAQPSRGGSGSLRNRRFAVPVERKACRPRVHRGCSSARIHDRDRAARSAGDPDANRRDRECSRNGGRGGDHRPITVNVSVAV